MADTILQLSDIDKIYDKQHVLNKLNLEVKAGEIIAITGVSGSGKSTLLHIAGLLDQASSGNIIINDIKIANHNDKVISGIRNKYIGYIYQFHHLMPEFNVIENVMMPMLINGKSHNDAINQAKNLLNDLEMQKYMFVQINTLSGGQLQRVAIARSLIMKPILILADEPTGNLDPASASLVFDLLIESAKKQHAGCIVVTHNMSLSKKADKILVLDSGKLTAM